MSSMSIPSSIRAISPKIPQFNRFPLFSFSSSSKPLISYSSFKSISFQRLPSRPQSLSSPPSSSSSSSSIQPIEELPPKLQEIITLFQEACDPRAKYQQLMFYANNLSPLQPQYKTKENKVEGCVSQVWVRAFLDSNSANNNEKVVYFEADSDSVMTKGLAALLVLGLSGQTIPDILRVSPDFITLLGLQQNLTPSRNNGFLNMLKLMQRKALLLGLEDEKNSGNEVSELSSKLGVDDSDRNVGNVALNGSSGVETYGLDNVADKPSPSSIRSESSDPDVGGNDSVAEKLSSSSDGLGRRGERIKEVLERELKPVKLELEDLSYQHAGHMGVKGSDGETHFNLKIVSNEFEGKSMVKRHRMIYGLLQDELQGGLHALSIVAKTPLELQQGS